MLNYDKGQLVQLLKDRALLFGRFTLSSGKVSDYYVDGRLATLSARGAALIGVGVLEQLMAVPDLAAVGGTVIGADPIVGAVLAFAGLSGFPDLEGFLVRKEAKGHGLQKLVEGPLQPGTTVAILDDVATTGGSAIHAVNAVRDMGCHVGRVIVVLDRLQGAAEAFHKLGIAYHALATIEDLGVKPTPA